MKVSTAVLNVIGVALCLAAAYGGWRLGLAFFAN